MLNLGACLKQTPRLLKSNEYSFSMKKLLSLFISVFLPCLLFCQTFQLAGEINGSENNRSLEGAEVYLLDTEFGTLTDQKGKFQFKNIPAGNYQLIVNYLGYEPFDTLIEGSNKEIALQISLRETVLNLNTVTVESQDESETFGITRLRAVEGTAIYAAKKNEVVVIDDLTANKATNNSRQIYAKVAGLNIWESDGAGVQLGIGGRGLSPNRNSNFNTRQNGYDISADALGYPESYYTPPVDAIDRIEIVRGAASLQYGTQFGGMLNFRFKEGPLDKPFEFNTRQTIGSFGLYTGFNSIGGTTGNVRYYAFYQYKKSDGWRINSSLDQHTAYASLNIQLSQKLSIRPEYTHTNYLAQQPGGLLDQQFKEDSRQSTRDRNWFKVDWNLFAFSFDYRFSESTRLNSRTFGLLAGRDALGHLDPSDIGGNRDFLSDDFRNWGNESRLIHKYTAFQQPATLLVGMRYYQGFTIRKQGDGNDGLDSNFEYLNPENLEGSDFDLPSRNWSFFAENVFNLTEKWSLTPGIRYESIRTEAEGYYKERSVDLAGNILLDQRVEEQKVNDRAFVFFGLGTSYKPSEKLEFYANFSQNYRGITFNDIRVNVGSLVVDPELRDERGYNADLGIRGNVPGLFIFDISAFHLAYKDRIGSILKTEPNPVFNNLVDRTIRFRTNVADANIFGLESFGELNVMRLLRPQSKIEVSLFLNLALIRATYTNSQENGVEGNDVELVPPVNIKSGLSFKWKELNLSYQYAFVQEHFTDASNAISTPSAIDGIIPSYYVMDLALSYQWKRFSIESGINNLDDNRYFTRRATGYPGPGIIPSDGRSFYLTIGLKL